MIVPTYTECTQTEFSQPIVSQTATCDYCITQEEYERLTADPYAETTSCSSAYPKKNVVTIMTTKPYPTTSRIKNTSAFSQNSILSPHNYKLVSSESSTGSEQEAGCSKFTNG